MIVPESLRKCVVFIGYRMDNGDMKFAGSAFFLGRSIGDHKSDFVHLITAKHVIERIRKHALLHVWIRVNLKNGDSAWFASETSHWKYHTSDASVDVAVAPCGIPEDWDHLVLPDSMIGTPQQLAAKEISLGDELFVVGLFHRHTGARRNIPIVRIGNVAVIQAARSAGQSIVLN